MTDIAPPFHRKAIKRHSRPAGQAGSAGASALGVGSSIDEEAADLDIG